jgi:CDP-diacylglycerol--glycerol-3-phosphate 3-phosphatidyltransferase
MKHVPNLLTALRILVTPLLLVLLLSETLAGQAWALGLFVVASISDYLDGKLARVYAVGSRLGQFLDPLADKVLVLSTFAGLAYLIPDLVPWWGVGLVALRDFVITGLRSWAEAQGRSIRTSYAAKVKTTLQLTFLITTLVVLVAARLPGIVGEAGRWVLGSWILLAAMVMVVIITLATGGLYLYHMEFNTPANTNP